MTYSTRIGLNTLSYFFDSNEELRDLTFNFLVIVSFLLNCIQIHEFIGFTKCTLSTRIRTSNNSLHSSCLALLLDATVITFRRGSILVFIASDLMMMLY